MSSDKRSGVSRGWRGWEIDSDKPGDFELKLKPLTCGGGSLPCVAEGGAFSSDGLLSSDLDDREPLNGITLVEWARLIESRLEINPLEVCDWGIASFFLFIFSKRIASSCVLYLSHVGRTAGLSRSH
jgi:hypothetical protein